MTEFQKSDTNDSNSVSSSCEQYKIVEPNNKIKVLKEPIHFSKLIPNCITLLSLIIGVSAIRFALDHKWEISIYCILIAAILDGLDGRVARLLNASSPFGAELDSLCDFVNFGLSPALLIYLWSFQQYEYKVLSWTAILLYIVCMAIRLARFNIGVVSTNDNEVRKLFHIGVPAPSGALLVLIPIMLDFDITINLSFYMRNYTLIIDLYIMLVAFLLASRLPTISIKNFYIKPEYLSLLMIAAAFFIIILVIYTWYVLPFIGLLYLVSIPICFCYVYRSFFV